MPVAHGFYRPSTVPPGRDASDSVATAVSADDYITGQQFVRIDPAAREGLALVLVLGKVAGGAAVGQFMTLDHPEGVMDGGLDLSFVQPDGNDRAFVDAIDPVGDGAKLPPARGEVERVNPLADLDPTRKSRFAS